MSKYKGWYAMKKRLEAQGKWKGASHRVPAQEEGETAAKQPKLTENQEEASGEAGGSPSDPEEGTSHNAQGMSLFSYISEYLWRALDLQADSHCWYGSRPTPGDFKIWLKSNAMIRREKSSKMSVPYYVGDGVWRVPLWKIAGKYTHSSPVPNLWLVQRHLLGL